MSKEKSKGGFTGLGRVAKADTSALVTNGVDAFPEDSFSGLYMTGGSTSSTAILEPSFKPGTLAALVTQNNTLAQCVEAMEVNIDGTGHSIALEEGASENEAEKVRLESFFSEPFPGKTMVAIRRDIRRDRETTGNGYMEVIRNGLDEVVMLNSIDSQDMRLVRLDEPVLAPRTIVRDGKDTPVQIRTRERRFVQLINGKKVFFKEFGSQRDLNRNTGEWVKDGKRLPIEQRASEIIHFCGNKEPKTPYGSPRWLNQLPSVLGSRKAEEFNLEFFDAGGLPPVLLIVQGGTIGDDVKDDLKNHLSGRGAQKHRAAIVEAVSTSGSIDSSGTVQVRVERFGSERQQDAMFQAYDKNCEEHVRTAFRLPHLFIGKASDMSFATAYTAYMVAEAQVFYPERDEFDATINSTVVRALGVKNYRFRSLPMTLVDVTNQLKAMEMAIGAKAVDLEEVVKSLNETTGLALKYKEPPKEQPPITPPNPGLINPPAAFTEAKDGAGGLSGGTPQGTFPAKKGEYLVQLAAQWCAALGLDGKAHVIKGEAANKIKEEVSALYGSDLDIVNSIVAAKALSKASVDTVGLGELCGCASHLVKEA